MEGLVPREVVNTSVRAEVVDTRQQRHCTDEMAVYANTKLPEQGKHNNQLWNRAETKIGTVSIISISQHLVCGIAGREREVEA